LAPIFTIHLANILRRGRFKIWKTQRGWSKVKSRL
jgi:hypothetical protein